MKRWILAAIVLAALGVAGFMALRMLTPPPADLDLALSKTSVNGLYVVTIAPETAPIQQGPLHNWIATITLPGGDAVTDATLAIDGGMPQHGHGLPTVPQSSGHNGDGRYRIEGVRFNMSGWWTLRLAISSPAGNDEVEFNLSL